MTRLDEVQMSHTLPIARQVAQVVIIQTVPLTQQFVEHQHFACYSDWLVTGDLCPLPCS